MSCSGKEEGKSAIESAAQEPSSLGTFPQTLGPREPYTSTPAPADEDEDDSGALQIAIQDQVFPGKDKGIVLPHQTE
jgi:hypothetical protein